MASQRVVTPSNASAGFSRVPSLLRVIQSRRPSCRARFQPQHAEENAHGQHPEGSPPAPSHQGSSHKIIGLGARGISALNRLAGSGHFASAKFWAIDSDRKTLSTAIPAVQCLEVSGGDDVTLQAHDLSAIAGQVEPGQLGEWKPDGAAGAAFVMGAALGSPGGATLMLQLVNHLRRQGHFVAAALTRPFPFEGARKLEQAAALIEMMEEVAHLVVVVDQGVLTRASADMTMSDACDIADKTLQYTVRSIMWALTAPEILKVSGGAFLWHGRDLRAMKRPLFPPMMSLLSCPGHAYLGRGQAALPPGNTNDVSLASLLSTLAEDATHAASESPFLEGHIGSASAVLCILIFPRDVVDPAAAKEAGRKPAQSSGTYQDNYREYALRSAVQVAALTVRELAGPNCRDIVVCPQVKEEQNPDQPPAVTRAASVPRMSPSRSNTTSDRGSPDARNSPSPLGDQASDAPPIMVECALLVIKGSIDSAPAGAATPRSSPASKTPSPSHTPSVSRLGSWAHNRPQPGQPPKQQSPQQRQQGLPAQSPLPQRGLPRQPVNHAAARHAHRPQWGRTVPSASPAAPATAPGRANPATPTHAAARSTPTAPAQPPPAQPTTAIPAWQAMSMIAGGSASAARSAHISRRALGNTGTPTRPLPGTPRGSTEPAQPVNSQSPTRTPFTDGLRLSQRSALTSSGSSMDDTDSAPVKSGLSVGPFQIPRVTGNLVSSLVATSLDLPPRAAKWRHQQRLTVRPKSVYEIQDAANVVDEDEGEGEAPQGAKRVSLAALLLGRTAEEPETDVRTRVAGMLEKERDF